MNKENITEKPLLRVRFCPDDTNETFTGTVIEERRHFYVVRPDENPSLVQNLNKKKCKILDKETNQDVDFDNNNLSRARAQIAFLEGNKISHKCFMSHEFVQLNRHKEMIDEDGMVLNKTDFWLQRGSKRFDDGWFIKE